MNLEIFKLEITRGIQKILPYARAHKGGIERKSLEPPGPEERYEFPPFRLIFTLEAFPGADVPMLSLSAPMRPTHILEPKERDMAKETFAECFPDHEVLVMKRAVMRGSTAFKMVALPATAHPGLRKAYQMMGASR